MHLAVRARVYGGLYRFVSDPGRLKGAQATKKPLDLKEQATSARRTLNSVRLRRFYLKSTLVITFASDPSHSTRGSMFFPFLRNSNNSELVNIINLIF